MSASTSMLPVKRRVTRACDFCHRRGLKCSRRGETDAPACYPCARHGVECTYDRPAKKRGPAARSKASDSPPSASPRSPAARPAPTASPVATGSTAAAAAPRAASPWRPSVLVPAFALLKVLQTYHEAVYPIFPYFVWPHFIAQVCSEEHLNNRPFYGTVMAASALALARIRDSAASSNPLSPKEAGALPSPETLFEAAEDAMPKDLTAATDFDYLRTTALLAITSIQFANPRKMYQHLGTFWTLSTMNRMHDEKRWPQVSRIEAEERRRVYWSMYTLDLFTSISFGSVLRTREATSLVAFPSEIDDEHLLSPDPVQPDSTLPWLIGWNFTSRLYRTLEHALDSGPGHDVDVNNPRLAAAAYLDLLDTAYASLPSAFKEMKPYANVPQQDRFGYQTANILVMLQTIRMVAVCRNLSDAAQRDQAVQIAETLLRDIGAVPLAYLQGISSPLISHLVGIYKLLFPITERPLTPDLFVRIRQLLIDMTTLLGRLESRLTYTIDVAQRFKSQISRMDDAQAIAASAPPSPRAAVQPLPQTTDEAQAGAQLGLDLGTTIQPSWEAAFELQDVFQDWPFDFSYSSFDAGNGLSTGDLFNLGAAGEMPGGGDASGTAAPSLSPTSEIPPLWW